MKGGAPCFLREAPPGIISGPFFLARLVPSFVASLPPERLRAPIKPARAILNARVATQLLRPQHRIAVHDLVHPLGTLPRGNPTTRGTTPAPL